MKRIFVFEYLTGGGLDGPAAAHGSLLSQGLAMRDAMVADLLRSGSVAVSAAVSAAAPALPPGAQPVRAAPGENLLAFVARQAAQHDAVWLVAPETDGLLGAFQRQVPAGRWLGCSAAAIALASSKSATLRHLSVRGASTPLDFSPAATRWVVKPDDGAGCVGTRLYRSLDAAHGARQAMPGLVLEPWVEGQAMSLSLLCHGGTAELLSINRQRIEIAADGQVGYRGVAIDALPRSGHLGDVMATLARQVVRAVRGLHGFVGIDLVWHDTSGPVLVELNPRPTCAYVGLSAALGRNLAAELLALPAVEERLHATA